VLLHVILCVQSQQELLVHCCGVASHLLCIQSSQTILQQLSTPQVFKARLRTGIPERGSL